MLHFLLIFVHELGVDLDLWWSEGWGGDELEGWVADQLSGEPEEGLLEVVVGLGGDVVVLQVLLSVEGDGLGLDLSLLHVDLVAAEHDRDVFADTHKVSVPVRNVLVGDSRRHVEHDDAALAVDVVAVTQTAKLLLTGRVPDLELDLAEVGEEAEWIHLHALCGVVLLLEFARQVALHKRGLPSKFQLVSTAVIACCNKRLATHLTSATVADEDELELRNLLFRHFDVFLRSRRRWKKKVGKKKQKNKTL